MCFYVLSALEKRSSPLPLPSFELVRREKIVFWLWLVQTERGEKRREDFFRCLLICIFYIICDPSYKFQLHIPNSVS